MTLRQVGCVTLLLVVGACGRNTTVNGVERVGLPPGVSAQERVETYPVVGADRVTIGRGIWAAPPGGHGPRYAGYHEWNLTWHYQTRPQGTFCSVAAATVAISSVVTLPEWTPPPGVDSGLVADWVRFRAALAQHEQGHRELILAGASRIQRAILALPDQSCAFVGSAAEAAVQPLLTALKADDARYDQETRHGATQGAVWTIR